MSRLFVKLNKPSPEEVKKYIKRWEETDEYSVPAKSLTALFEKFPLSNNLDEIIAKVCTLDTIFSANAGRWFFQLSRHIKDYEFDKKLQNNELDINNFMLLETINKKTNKTKVRKLYSFATKYCHHHKPLEYPIYDSYLDKVLWRFQKQNSFSDFSRGDLKTYSIFKKVLNDFREFFGLQKFDLREIDKYLWLLGKESFG